MPRCQGQIAPKNIHGVQGESHVLQCVQCFSSLVYVACLNEPRYEKAGFLNMRKQRRRSAAQ